MPSGAVSRGACNRGHDAARRLLKPPRSPHRSGAPCQGQSPPRLPPPPRQEAGGLGRVAHGFISGDLAGQAVRAIWRAPEKLSQPRGGAKNFGQSWAWRKPGAGPWALSRGPGSFAPPMGTSAATGCRDSRIPAGGCESARTGLPRTGRLEMCAELLTEGGRLWFWCGRMSALKWAGHAASRRRVRLRRRPRWMGLGK